MGLAKETGFNLVILTEVAQGHGSAISISSFDSYKCKSTLVRDSGPAGLGWARSLRHDSIAQHTITDCEVMGFRFWIWGKQERADNWPQLLASWATKWGVSWKSQILIM